MDDFINEIETRSQPKSYEALKELFACFTYTREFNINAIKVYEDAIDVERLKCESKSFVCFKTTNNNINWSA